MKIKKIVLVIMTLMLFGCNTKKDTNNTNPMTTVQTPPQEEIEKKASYVGEEYIVVDKNYEFMVECETKITNDNLYNYVMVIDRYGQAVKLGVETRVEQQKQYYNIYTDPTCGYVDGETYNVYINDTVYFKDFERNIYKLTLEIKKEETYIYDYKDDYVYINKNDCLEQDDAGTYLIVQQGEYSIGEIVALGNGESVDNNTEFYKITDVQHNNGLTLLLVCAPEYEEIFDELDVYTVQELDYDEVDLLGVLEEEVLNQIEKTSTYQNFENMAVKMSKRNAVKDKIKCSFLLERVDEGIKATISFAYKDTIDKVGNLEIKLIFEPLIKVDIKANANLDIKWYALWDSSLSFDFATITTVETKITLKISVDNDTAPKNIVDKVKGLLEAKSGREKIASYLDRNEGDNAVNFSLFSLSYTIPYTPLTVNLKISIVVDLSYRIEMETSITHTLKCTSGAKSTSDGIECYSDLDSDFEFDEMTILGAFNVNAGVNAEIFLSVVGLQKYVKIGIDGEVGAYLKMVGAISIKNGEEVGITNSFDYYVEAGWYFESNLKYKFIKFEGEKNIAYVEKPVWTLGQRYSDLEFYPLDYNSGKEGLEKGFKPAEDFVFQMKASTEALDVVLPLRLITMDLITQNEAKELVRYEECDVSLKSGESMSYANGKIAVKRNMSGESNTVIEDVLVVSYTKNQKMTCEIPVRYVDVMNLDGVIRDAGIIYSLNDEGNGYEIVSAEPTITEANIKGTVGLADGTSTFPVTKIANGAFKGCQKLEKVTVADSIKDICAGAFIGCTSLEEISINSVTNLEMEAFRGCTKLRNVEIKGVKNIYEYTFSGCTSLAKVVLSDELEKIGNYAFFNTNLSYIELPSSLSYIGNNAFSNVLSLRVIKISSTEMVDLSNNPFFNNESKFYIVVNDNLVNGYMEKYRNYKENIISSNDIVDDYIIEENHNGVKIIAYLGKETVVEIPEEIDGKTVVEIGKNAFGQSLCKAILSSSINRIQSYAFEGCKNLKEVVFNSEEVPYLGVGIFEGTSDLKIYVPEAAYAEYFSSSSFMMYSEQIIKKN